MRRFAIPLWKEAPFLRLLIPLAAGIIAERYLHFSQQMLFPAFSAGFVFLLLFSLAPVSLRFRYPWLGGFAVHILLFVLGMLLMSYHHPAPPPSKPPFSVVVKAPPAEKPKTWKVVCSDNISVYFRKDSLLQLPSYGQRILFLKVPDSTRKVFLRSHEFLVLDRQEGRWFQHLLFALQHQIVQILQRYITGQKECGLAEALLIGYKNDVDRELMSAYSNTGVIHVIAISGLHLGLIYMLLKYFCRRLGRWLTPLIIIGSLWVFSLLTGGSPSVMRAAVMFTFMIAGETFTRSSCVYNHLSASAFVLLCYNPIWLWDIGFQLSYAALLSIVVFQKPIYHLWLPSNKFLEKLWELNAVTLAAQVLTTPLCIYYFHQFPNLFLISNFIAVPLSSIVLLGEILLCTISFFSWPAMVLGKGISFLIQVLNNSVEYLGNLRFSTTGNLQINLFQVILLYLMIIIAWRFVAKRIS